MIDTLDSFYQESTAGILLVIREADEPLPVLALSCVDQDMEDPDYVLNAEVGLGSEHPLNSHRSMATYLSACCKDFIEVSFPENDENCLGHRVDSVHRSVRDILHEQDIVRTLKAWAAAEFSPRF